METRTLRRRPGLRLAREDSAVVGRNVRSLRQKTGMQLNELAARMGLAPSTLSRLETGKRLFRDGDVGRLVRIFGLRTSAELWRACAHCGGKPEYEGYQCLACGARRYTGAQGREKETP